MAGSLTSANAAQEMLRDLLAIEALAASLEGTAPRTIAEAGGPNALIAKCAHRTGAWFWTVAPLSDVLWERMAEEHQATYRTNPSP
jgi:hypothetical protein